VAKRKPMDEKLSALSERHALNARAQAVTDPTFSENPFFDPRDLVQVKYEMLRRVHKEGQSISHTAAAFGFSRPSFYQAQAAFEAKGLPGLLPDRPGPRGAHKLTDKVMDYVERALAENEELGAPQLAEIVHDAFGLSVHPRSIERGLLRRQKERRAFPP